MEGARFLEHARVITRAVAAAVRSPLLDRKGPAGKLWLGMTYTVVGYYMSRHYARFRKTYPQIEIEVLELPRDALESGLMRGEIDMAVMLVSNLAHTEELAQEILMRSNRRLWLSADHHLLARQEISLVDVAAEDYFMLTVDEARTTAARYWDAAGFRFAQSLPPGRSRPCDRSWLPAWGSLFCQTWFTDHGPWRGSASKCAGLSSRSPVWMSAWHGRMTDQSARRPPPSGPLCP